MNIGDDERKENVLTYFNRAKKRITGLVDGFDKQFYAEGLKDIWHSFDAFLGINFPDKTNLGMRKKFAMFNQPLFQKWQMSGIFKDAVKRLKISGRLFDMSPINPKKPIEITDTNSLLEILNFSYRVRSNLNHGSKDLESESGKARRNRFLVEFSFKATYEILEKTLIENKII